MCAPIRHICARFGPRRGPLGWEIARMASLLAGDLLVSDSELVSYSHLRGGGGWEGPPPANRLLGPQTAVPGLVRGCYQGGLGGVCDA